jgi:hypothetical protein
MSSGFYFDGVRKKLTAAMILSLELLHFFSHKSETECAGHIFDKISQ